MEAALYIPLILLALCIRGLYILSKDNSGKIRCKGLMGRFLHHRFVEDYGDRVCSICGLVQKREPAGILFQDGDTYYDKGYAENKNELIDYYLDKIRDRREQTRLYKQRYEAGILHTKIKTPLDRKIATKEDDP